MLAKVFNSKVMIFILDPEKGELDETVTQNLKKAKDILDDQDISYELIRETSKVYGIGYAKQALEYSEKHNVELFSIMAHAARDDSYFGNVERSEFILNKKGIPVLCCTE